MMMLGKWMAGIGLLAALALGCSDQPGIRQADAGPSEGIFTIVVTTYPLEYFAGRLAGEEARVLFPVPDGMTADEWSPGVEDLAAMQDADVVFLNGAGLESWIHRVSLPQARLVNTSRGFREDYIVSEEAVWHHHGDGQAHAHDGVDPHVWLDPIQAASMAHAMHVRLLGLMRDRAEDLEERHRSLQDDLASLHELFAASVAPLEGTPLLASHPVYQYFARRYGLEIHSMHLEPELPLTGEQWEDLEVLLGGGVMPLMLWEGEPLAETTAGLADRGVRVVVFSTCITAPDSGDYLSSMRDNASRLAAAAKDLR